MKKLIVCMVVLVASGDALFADEITRLGGFSSLGKMTENELHVSTWGVTNTSSPWRIVGGVTNYLPATTNWFRVRGKVEQVSRSWALVSGQAANEAGKLTNTLFFVRNLPYTPEIGDTLPEQIIGKRLGESSYKSASGELRRAMVLDHGIVCAAQAAQGLAVAAPSAPKRK